MKKITKELLKRIFSLHKMVRTKEKGSVINKSEDVNLVDVDLSCAYLKFENVDLISAYLKDANLKGADLRG